MNLSVTGLEAIPGDNTITFFQPSLSGSPASAFDAAGTIVAVTTGTSHSATINLTQFGPANSGLLYAAISTSCCTSPVGAYTCISNADSEFVKWSDSAPQSVTKSGTTFFLLGNVGIADIFVNNVPAAQISSSAMSVRLLGSGFQSCDASLPTISECLGLTAVRFTAANGSSYVSKAAFVGFWFVTHVDCGLWADLPLKETWLEPQPALSMFLSRALVHHLLSGLFN